MIPKAQKKTVKLSIFFALLGSTSAKAVRKRLMKLTLGLVQKCVSKNQWNLFLLGLVYGTTKARSLNSSNIRERMNLSRNLILKKTSLLHGRHLRLALGRVSKRGFRVIIHKSSEMIYFESLMTTLMWGLFLRAVFIISKCPKTK